MDLNKFAFKEDKNGQVYVKVCKITKIREMQINNYDITLLLGWVLLKDTKELSFNKFLYNYQFKKGNTCWQEVNLLCIPVDKNVKLV